MAPTPVENTVTPVEVFCSYAHADETWRAKLVTALAPLQRQGLISLWHDRLLVPGTEWAREIDEHLNSATVILLLLSADFFASNYCDGIEMTRALERHDAAEARVIPVLLRDCDWQYTPVARLQALPAGAQPLARWKHKDEGLTSVATGIRLALEDLDLLRASQASHWNVPFAPNPFFSGRDEELDRLHTRFQRQSTAAIGQSASISGLGGVGKTQLAVEYAYRHRTDYHAVLWANADSLESLNASYSEIAACLALPQRANKEQEIVIQAVRRWLETQRDYLLVLDNLDEPALLFPPDAGGQPTRRSPFLPAQPGGHVLITTRAADLSGLNLGLAHPLALTTFAPEVGARLLLTRAGLLDHATPWEQADTQMRELALQITEELGGLALALDQAGAYLATTGESLAGYLSLLRQRLVELLKHKRGREYPEAVATTWDLSFARVAEQNPTAADLLRCCAFLAPAAIPEELLTKGAEELGETLAPVLGDPLAFNAAIEALRAYSLLTRDPAAHLLSVHRLVQAVLRESLPTEEQQEWQQRVIAALDAAYPGSEVAAWPVYERLLPHAQFCATWIEQDATLATPIAARLLNQAGYYLDDRARYEQAEPLYERALAIREQALGATHPHTAQSLNNLAGLYANQGKYAEAEPLDERALVIWEQALGATHPHTATSLNNLALLYKNQGKYAEAEPLYERALAIWEQALGATHPDTAQSLNNLAGLYAHQGKYAEAEPLYERALAIREQALGATHPHTAQSLNNLALLYKNQGKYAEAEPLYERALVICEQALGATHPDTASSLNNLAALYAHQGKYAEAESLYERALAICEQALGATHPHTAISLNNLALLYAHQGKYAEAEPLDERALAIREQALGATHPHTAQSLNNLALLYDSQGKYAEAEPLYERALAICEQALGATHPHTAQSLNNLAGLYAHQGKYAEAEPLDERALAIREQALGATHPDTAQSLNNLALLYDSQGKYAEAEPLLRRACIILLQHFGEDHPDTQSTLRSYANLRQSMEEAAKTGQPDEQG